MRNNEKILNAEDERSNIKKPVIISVLVVVLLTGILIWSGIKTPRVFSAVRDLLVTILAIVMAILAAALAVLCFLLASRIDSARDSIDKGISQADNTIEDLAEKVTNVLKAIMDPFIEAKSKKAGLLGLFAKKKSEER